MRITGGALAGRTLYCPPGIIRPAMDRMRESLFSILGDLTGYSFLDLFSGSGGIALEAYSRGARPVVAVERDRGKKNILLRNLEMAPETIRAVFTPVERFIVSHTSSYHFIFLDPPFNYRYKSDLLAKISASRLLNSDTRVLIHYPAEEKIPEEIGELHQTRKEPYGRSMVSFYGVS